MSCVDESAQAEGCLKEDDSKFPIGLRKLEEEKNNVITKDDSFVEEGLVACELVASKASGDEMMGQKSDRFDIQDNEIESISGTKDVMVGQSNDSLDMQVNEVVESISGSNHDEEGLMGHKSDGNLDIQIISREMVE